MRNESACVSPRGSTTARRNTVLRQPWDDVLVGPTCAPPSVKLATGKDAALGAVEQEQKALIAAQKSVDALLREADRHQSKMVSSFLQGTAAWLDNYYHVATVSPRKVPTLTGQITAEPIVTRRYASPARGALRESVAFLTPRKSKLVPSRSRETFASDATQLSESRAPGSAAHSGPANQFNWAHFSPAVESARQAHLPRVVASIPTTTAEPLESRPSEHVDLESVLNELLYRCESFLQENVEDDIWCFDVAAESALLNALRASAPRLDDRSDAAGLARNVFLLLRREAGLRTPEELLNETIDDPSVPNRGSEKRRASRRKSSSVALPENDSGALWLAVERVRRGEGPSRSQWRRLANALRSAVGPEGLNTTV